MRAVLSIIGIRQVRTMGPSKFCRRRGSGCAALASVAVPALVIPADDAAFCGNNIAGILTCASARQMLPGWSCRQARFTRHGATGLPGASGFAAGMRVAALAAPRRPAAAQQHQEPATVSISSIASNAWTAPYRMLSGLGASSAGSAAQGSSATTVSAQTSSAPGPATWRAPRAPPEPDRTRPARSITTPKPTVPRTRTRSQTLPRRPPPR